MTLAIQFYVLDFSPFSFSYNEPLSCSKFAMQYDFFFSPLYTSFSEGYSLKVSFIFIVNIKS